MTTLTEVPTVSAQQVFAMPVRTDSDLPAATVVGLTPLTDLDVASEAAARAELLRRCEDAGPHRWVVLTATPTWFVDVRGLAVLLDGAAAARRYARELVVLDAPVSLRLMVTTLGLQEQLRLVDDLAELTDR